jgi:flagellar basal-body rod modification protein FlgD
MEVTQPTQQTQQTQQSGQSSGADSTTPSGQISSDFETFLKMLTVQMKNQDPLNPVESTDYATQLATFSGVEQAVLTNDLLKSLTTQMSVGGLVDMAALVGKEVRSAAPVFFDGQPLELLPAQSVTGDTIELVVRNQAGDEVQRVPVPQGSDTIRWTGISANETPFLVGLYSFEIVGKSDGEVVSESSAEAYSRVQEVRIEAGKTVLLFAGGASISSDEVTALREVQN